MDRDQIALEAMKILLSSRLYEEWESLTKNYATVTIPKTIANLSYMIADEMIKKANED